MLQINVEFDFTTDTPTYWNGFWERRDGLGLGACDPDTYSSTLKAYHQLLWSKPLPNGDVMDLKPDPSGYLSWKVFRFGSDSIIVDFRYERCRELLKRVEASIPDYRAFVEDNVRKSYTIGGMIIFPRHQNSLNQIRGWNRLICDRWDLTLECIRRYYAGVKNPLSWVLESDKAFFDLFVNFKGYVDFFFLQDCVSADYSSVDIWLGDGNLETNPLPKTVEEYLHWIKKEMEFLQKRNNRIKAYAQTV